MKQFNHVPVTLEELKSTTVEGKRMYETPEGNFPSITTVLSRQVQKQKSLTQWRKRVGEENAKKISAQASRRGTGMHKLVENYLDNQEGFLTEALPDTIQMFSNLQAVIDLNLDNIRGIEIPLWSSMLGLAGRCDCVAEWNNILSIVDWKTSSKIKKREWVDDYFLQGTAYSIMFQERTGIPVKQIVIAISVADEPEPQVFVENPMNHVPKLKEIIDTYC